MHRLFLQQPRTSRSLFSSSSSPPSSYPKMKRSLDATARPAAIRATGLAKRQWRNLILRPTAQRSLATNEMRAEGSTKLRSRSSFFFGSFSGGYDLILCTAANSTKAVEFQIVGSQGRRYSEDCASFFLLLLQLSGKRFPSRCLLAQPTTARKLTFSLLSPLSKIEWCFFFRARICAPVL